jgi:type IV pilus biogenesis protein CpaD/CtpE
MAMPTRLPVLLQRRKSALAGKIDAPSNSAATTAARAMEKERRHLKSMSGNAVTFVAVSE